MSTSKNTRDCPAAGKQIAAAECAESRHSRYACPEDCPHNTFSPSNYNRLLEVAEKSDRLMFEYFATQPVMAAQIGRELRSLQETGRQDRAGMLVMDWFHFRPDAEGLSFFERWEKQGFPGLRNDQRVFHQRRAGLRPSLIEVRQIVDAEQMIAVDLLEPEAEEFLLLDRSLASLAPRFSTWLVWTYDLPHCRLLHGAMFEVDPIHDLGPAEVLEILLDHLGCPKSASERRRWMLDGFLKVKESLDAAIQFRLRTGMESMDTRPRASMLPKLPPLDPDLQAKVPPRLLENPPVLPTESVRVSKALVDTGGLERDIRMDLLRAWMNEPVPALRGQTPREAAVDLELRPRLVQLVKDRVRDFDLRNLNEGITGDMNWALRDLGLDEWIYPPPPPRPRLARQDDPENN